MNVNGIISKAQSKAELIATLYGVLADPMDAGRGLSGAPAFAMDRLKNWKVPNLQKTLEQIQFYPKYKDNFVNGATFYLLGEGLKALGVPKYGNIAKKIGKGVIKGTALAALLWLPAINPTGTTQYPTKSGNSPIVASNGYGY